jgi:site-specific recombinase XerD
MPKQRKRDGVHWRKDVRQWWVSYVDAQGRRVCEPAILKDGREASTGEEAQTVREDKRREVRERRNLKPGEAVICQDTFAGVADKFLAYQKPRLLGRNSYQREAGIADYLKEFSTGKLADVTPSQVSDYVTMRLGKKMSNSSVRKELVALKHLFRLACGEWKMLPRYSNPCLDVTTPKVHDERTQHLSPEQFRRVLAAAPDKMKPIFALLTATGMRRSELLGCKRKFADGTRILLPTSKNDEPKEVHLNVFAQQVLASIPQGGPDDLLFPGVSPEAVSMAFHHTCKILCISDIRLHDLRHTFATWLRQRGVELDVIASQLGHRDLRMTKRYARIASAQVKDAVAGLDSMLPPVQEAQTGRVSRPFVTEGQEAKEGDPATALESWRPRRDLNPCYRRERAVS